MNALAYIFIAWVPIFTFPTYKQPYIVTGNYINAGFAAAAVLLALAIGYFDERDRKRAALADKSALNDSETGLGSDVSVDEKARAL